MNKVGIKLKQGFRLKSYNFGYSSVNDIASVFNWQDGNNVFDVQRDGFYYFFVKHKVSNKYSVFGMLVNCGGVQVSCIIGHLTPYAVANAQTICVISYLKPYEGVGALGDTYENDWVDGQAIGEACIITFINPYNI